MATPEGTETEVKHARKYPKHLKAWVWAAFTVVVGGGLLLTMHVLNTPARGVVTVHHSPDTNQSSKPQRTIQGKTVTFQYSAELQPVKADTLVVGDIEKFLFSFPQHGDWSLAILVKKLPGSSLSQDGNYNLRKQNPQQYTEETTTINGSRASIMTDHSAGYNQVAFLTHADMVAEVAMSGQEGSSDLSQAIFTAVLNSWQWL